MRYLVLSDIHGNLEALQAVLADAPEHDAVLFLGDLVGYGPNPNECVERVASLAEVTSLLGNHDLAALGRLDLDNFNPFARYSAEWTAARLTRESRDYLESLVTDEPFEGAYMAHASPRDPVWEYMESPEQGPPNFALFDQGLGFVGHTHVPRVFHESLNGAPSAISMPEAGMVLDLDDDVRKIINPGGVGQPRNGDPRAAYGLWDQEAGTFEFRRVPYPVDITQIKMRIGGLPSVLAQRLAYGM